MARKLIWSVVVLVGTYILCQAIADIGATKFVQLGDVVIPGGTFIFAITFTLRDMIHKRLGKEWAQAAIVTAGGLNILQAGYLWFISKLPSPVFYEHSSAWESIFAIVPAIAIGSIAAEVVSELIDTEVYHFWKTKFSNAPQWTRVLVSNAVSLPVDSLIFATLAFVILPPLFGENALPFFIALSLTVGQISWKFFVTIVSLPMIYFVKDETMV